ncbi:hypothetical protein J4404_03795 [Candidatus Woesearchaeota archaeon]|nr:hypothetical protein [Candidatus Woesearchaeota archaeon]
MFEKLAVLGAGFLAIFIILAIWEMIWKGIALWKAAKNGDTAWYIAILILNTIGILPIVYLLINQKKPKTVLKKKAKR